MIVVLFGQPCSGKTTLANQIEADYYIDITKGLGIRQLYKLLPVIKIENLTYIPSVKR